MGVYTRISEISVNQVMVFLKCMELENYSKAAEALNFTPSMVSKTIHKLEEKLGLVLFIRRGGQIRPTSAARQLRRDWASAVRGCPVHRTAGMNQRCQRLSQTTTLRTSYDILEKRSDQVSFLMGGTSVYDSFITFAAA